MVGRAVNKEMVGKKGENEGRTKAVEVFVADG